MDAQTIQNVNIHSGRIKLDRYFCTEEEALSAGFKKADLAFHTIAKIEAGSTPNPTIDTVKKIADALGVSLDTLMK